MRNVWTCLTIAAAGSALLGSFVFGGLIGRYEKRPLLAPIAFADSAIRRALRFARGQEPNERFVETTLYELKLTTLDLVPDDSGDIVAFSPFQDGYLLARRSGQLIYAEVDWPAQSRTRTLAIEIPTNKDLFLREGATGKHPRIAQQFGAKDVAVLDTSGIRTIYASHHYWLEQDACAVLRVSRYELPLGDDGSSRQREWTTIFESSPCMLLDSTLNRLGQDDTFLQAGGRIAELDSDNILITVGDHFFDGIHNRDLVSDPMASYGKTIVVNKRSGQSRVFTLGHRNAQGLLIDGDGHIWSTEHGPRGGDELNLLQPGRNFGWPYASHGTLYAGYEYPKQIDWSKHAGYTEPKYFWSPSIAVSSLIRLSESRFPRWQNNLIIGSLADRSIHRVYVAGTEVVGVERIPIGFRLRDIDRARDGNLVLMTDNGELIRIEPDFPMLSSAAASAVADPVTRGRQLWLSCSACHRVSDDLQHSIGPNLYGVLGRKFAGLEGFEYSDALAARDDRWTRENLDRYLRSPEVMVPGTTMIFPGLDDAADRSAIIDYLERN